jgi:hypothetical protein
MCPQVGVPISHKCLPNDDTCTMKKVLMLLCLIPTLSFGLDRMTALSMLETCDNDRMVGKAGEISRYQVLKQEWKRVCSSTDYTNPAVAKAVAEKLITERVQRFQRVFGRLPTHFEFYGLWNAPGQVLNKRVSPVVAERCERYANLCNARNAPMIAAKTSKAGHPVL